MMSSEQNKRSDTNRWLRAFLMLLHVHQNSSLLLDMLLVLVMIL